MVFRSRINAFGILIFIWSLTKITFINSTISKITFIPLWHQECKLFFSFSFGPFQVFFSGDWIHLLFRSAIWGQVSVLSSWLHSKCYSVGLLVSCLCCFVLWDSQCCDALRCTIPSKQYHQGSSCAPIYILSWTSYSDVPPPVSSPVHARFVFTRTTLSNHVEQSRGVGGTAATSEGSS